LAHPAVRTAHARHTSVQQRAMLEEVQMPPRLVLRVVNCTTLASALSAGEPAPTRKIHVQIEPTILDRKLATRHRPRRLQPKGQLEKIGVSHPLTINSIPTDRSPSEPRKRPYPLLSARSLVDDANATPCEQGIARLIPIHAAWHGNTKCLRQPTNRSIPAETDAMIISIVRVESCCEPATTT